MAEMEEAVKAEWESLLQTEWAGKAFYYFKTTDSTNLRAKQAAEQNAPHGAVFVAEEQTAGRGRRGRSWQSRAGGNLYFTLLLRPDLPIDKVSMLTLVMALSTAEGIAQVLAEGKEDPSRIGIKWPNDIVLDGRKVCGILTELEQCNPKRNQQQPGGLHYVVIGVGVNLKKQAFPEELRDKAVALEEVCDTAVSRSILLADILRKFEEHYAAFLACENMSLLKERYQKRLVNRNRQVRVLDPKGEFDGVAKGIADTGELIVELENGDIRKIYAGEVSVRGIYGYI